MEASLQGQQNQSFWRETANARDTKDCAHLKMRAHKKDSKSKWKELANGSEEEVKQYLHGGNYPQDPSMGMAIRTDGKSLQKGLQRSLPGTRESVVYSILNTFKQLRIS